MNKVITFITSIVLCISSFISPMFVNNDMITVEMLSYTVDTDYSVDDAYVVYHEDNEDNVYSAEVIEIDTNKVLQTYTEKPNIPIDDVKELNTEDNTASIKTYITIWDTYVDLFTFDNETIRVYVWVQVRIKGDFSWMQVEEVLNMGHSSSGSENYSVAPAGTYVKTSKFPSTKDLYIDINGVVSVNSSNTAGITLEELKLSGFTLSNTLLPTWVASNSYNKQVGFKVMR